MEPPRAMERSFKKTGESLEEPSADKSIMIM